MQTAGLSHDPGPSSGDDRWRLVGHAILPRPIGNRCFIKSGTQQWVITERGLIPLTSEIFEYNIANSYVKQTDKIDDAWIEAAGFYNGNFGWQGMIYPKGPWLLINVPVSGNTVIEQFVMNQQTGAWAKFCGMNANCWTVHNGNPYFGGIDGKVYQADYGNDDDGGGIDAEIQTSYTNFGNPQQLKWLHLGRPVMEATQGTEFYFEAEVDFEKRALINTVSVAGAGATAWGSAWGSPWGALKSNIREWYSIAGFGRYASLRLQGNYKDIDFSISSFDTQFTPGGTL